MKPLWLLLGAVLLAAPAALDAQSDTRVSGWGGVYLDPGTVRDEGSGTEWDFGTSFSAGAGIQRRLGSSLVAGLEVDYSPVRHEVRSVDAAEGAEPLADGRAHLFATMLTARMGGGGGGFYSYVGGGIGAVTYGIPSLERWDSDFAFRFGPGLEYGHSEHLSLFAQWNRWWVIHQAEGVDDNTVRHSSLQIGARYAL